MVVTSEPKIQVVGNYSPSNHDATRIVDPNGIAPTVKENHGSVTAVVEPQNHTTEELQVFDLYNKKQINSNIVGTITTGCARYGSGTFIVRQGNNRRIRKLTPKECFRLMGFSDEDFTKAESINSNTQLYKQAGNSIVVDVVQYIFQSLIKCGAMQVGGETNAIY